MDDSTSLLLQLARVILALDDRTRELQGSVFALKTSLASFGRIQPKKMESLLHPVEQTFLASLPVHQGRQQVEAIIRFWNAESPPISTAHRASVAEGNCTDGLGDYLIAPQSLKIHQVCTRMGRGRAHTYQRRLDCRNQGGLQRRNGITLPQPATVGLIPFSSSPVMCQIEPLPLFLAVPVICTGGVFASPVSATSNRLGNRRYRFPLDVERSGCTRGEGHSGLSLFADGGTNVA
jgi:hypothetical protein